MQEGQYMAIKAAIFKT